jgi:hypothetical protein
LFVTSTSVSGGFFSRLPRLSERRSLAICTEAAITQTRAG